MVSPLGLLVQSCCGEGGALQTNVTGLCGEHLQCSSHTGFTPAHWCVFSPSALLRLPAALYGVGPALRVAPVFGYSTKARTRLGLSFVPSPAQQLSSQELDRHTLPWCSMPYPLRGSSLFLHAPVGCVRLVSVLGSWSLAVTLPADVNHPESQEVFG